MSYPALQPGEAPYPHNGVVPHLECVVNDPNQNVATYAVTVGDVQVVETVLGWRLLLGRIMKHWLGTDRTGEVDQ